MTYDTIMTILQISAFTFIAFVISCVVALHQYDKSGKFKKTFLSLLIAGAISGIVMFTFLMMLENVKSTTRRNLMVLEQKYQIESVHEEIFENYKVYEYNGYQIKYITLKNTIIIIP